MKYLQLFLIILLPQAAAFGSVASLDAVRTSDCPAAVYRFSENSGAIVADSSGSAHNGALSGGFTRNGAPLVNDDAADTSVTLDGTASFSTTTTNWFSASAGLTVEGSFKPTTLDNGKSYFIAEMGNAGGSVGFARLYYIHGSGLRFLHADGTQIVTTEYASTFAANRIYHLAATLDITSKTVNLFIDGAAVKTQTYAATPLPINSCGVGRVGLNVIGSIDEVALYQTALSSAAIRSHFLAERGAAQEETNFYAAPSGRYDAHGTLADPVDLPSGIANGFVVASTTLWLRGGTYAGAFDVRKNGANNSAGKILIRNYSNERAILDVGSMAHGSALRIVNSAFVWIWGLELLSSDAHRTATTDSSLPATTDQLRGTGLDAGRIEASTDIKFINCWIHDGGNGISAQSGTNNIELYGNILYNNGWMGLSVSAGNGLYLANNNTDGKSYKYVKENFAFNNFNQGFQYYSDSGRVENFYTQGNVNFNNGSPFGAYLGSSVRRPNFTTDSADAEDDLVFDRNWAWQPFEAGNYNSSIGRISTANTNLTFTNNKMLNGGVGFGRWNQVTGSGNIISGANSSSLLSFKRSSGRVDFLLYSWNNNFYYNKTNPNVGYLYGYNATGLTQNYLHNGLGGATTLDFSNWKSQTLQDGASLQAVGVNAPAMYEVRPNAYEVGRANIVVYNPDLSSTVSVNLSDAGLINGQTFSIYDVEKGAGAAAIQTGTFDIANSNVSIPMTAAVVAQPVGWDYTIASAKPEFGVFLVVPNVLEAVGAPPTAPSETIVRRRKVGQIRIFWKLNSDNETSVTLERSANLVDWTIIKLAAGSMSYIDSKLSGGKYFYYRIKASNLAGDSPYSPIGSTFIFGFKQSNKVVY